MSNEIKNAPKSIYQVLSFHISSYKTERDGVRVNVNGGADDVYEHIGPNTVSHTIEEILRSNGLTQADVISITGNMTGKRDTGSWDFWMFCRNPSARKDETNSRTD
jgi:hypothetical protein